MRYGAVIVAAGESARAEKYRQLMRVGDMSLIQRIVTSFKRAGVDDIVVVTGYQADRIEDSLENRGVIILRNEDYANTEMLDSAKIGFSYLAGKVDRVFFTPADIPFFLEDTIRLEMSKDEGLVFPICKNRLGHPVLFEASLIPEILAYGGPGGLKGALDSLYSETACFLPVDDEGAVIRVDTRENLQHIIDIQNSRLMRVETTVTLVCSDGFFGPGTRDLLKQVDRLGSVRRACEEAGISYSKGWQVIRNAERDLGYQVIERKAGGKHGGSARLTERGAELIELYEQLEKRVSRAADREFADIFSASSLFSNGRRESCGGGPDGSESRGGGLS